MDQKSRYLIPPYKISILSLENQSPLYTVDSIFKTEKYNSLCYNIEKNILTENGFLDSEILKLDVLLKFLKNTVRRFLEKKNFDNSKKINSFLKDWIVYKILDLENIMPLLLDDQVQEIYLDKPNTTLFIDHQIFGRCLTNIKLTDAELEAIKTRLCLEKDTIINYLNPSLKVELKTDDFHVRAAIDIPPLASDGFSMNIRKLRKKIWTLPELISYNMLSIEAAAYILFIMRKKCNLTIIGEPGSGKTTLANAFDLLTPQKWRKITVEDVIESIDQKEFGIFQTRYSVSPFDNRNILNSKSDEIIKLLHRSPTWVYLGEIQTAEHSKALFEALSAGLVGMQTCHGQSIEMMLIRWMNQHKIPASSILTLDCLIETHSNFEDWKIKRSVHKIVEISNENINTKSFNNSINDLDLVEIFNFDFKKNKLVKEIDLFDSPTLKKIRRKENLEFELFIDEFNRIKQTLEYLQKNELYSPQAVRQYLTNSDIMKIKQNNKIK